MAEAERQEADPVFGLDHTRHLDLDRLPGRRRKRHDHLVGPDDDFEIPGRSLADVEIDRRPGAKPDRRVAAAGQRQTVFAGLADLQAEADDDPGNAGRHRPGAGGGPEQHAGIAVLVDEDCTVGAEAVDAQA